MDAFQVRNHEELAIRGSRIFPRETYQAILNVDESALQEKSGACLIRLKSPR
jgi:hypothetical protein